MSDPGKALEFFLPPKRSAEAVFEALCGDGARGEQGSYEVRHTFLDTFDWRLYRDGSCLEASGPDPAPLLQWRRLGTPEVLRQLHHGPPRFARDLPGGPFRADLEKVVEMRALLAQAHVLCRVREAEWRDRRGKTVLRLRLEENRLPAGDGATATALRTRVRLAPVRGYAKPLQRAQRRLGEMGLAPADRDLLDEALAAVGTVPAAYSSKVRVPLTADQPAAEAMRAILRHLVDTMEANEAGTVADLDSEFLHDFRVAVRRTRSALGQIKGVFPPDVEERFRSEFAWLGAITSPTRDMDVYLLNLPSYRDSLPPAVGPHLEPLQRFLRAHQRTEQRTLAKALGKRRYRKLKRDWRTFLDTPEDPAHAPPNSQRPVLDVARERIWKVYRRVLRDGAALGAASPAQAFHELRKTCKKLRYLLEFFQTLFPAREMAKLIRALKRIQDNLGVHNDLEVQAAALTEFARRMQEEGEVPSECLLAMGMLVEDLGARQVRTRGEFAALFGEFSGKPVRKQFDKLFRAPGKTEKGRP